MSETTERFEQWAVVEVFGHKTYAGFVTEQTIGGCAFVRVDVPATEREPAFSKLFGQGAIYCITPTTEDVARMAAARVWSDPLPVYLPQMDAGRDVPALPVMAPSFEIEMCDPFEGEDVR